MIDKKIAVIIIGVLLFDGVVAGINHYHGQEREGDHELLVAVTIPPQREFVKEVGGDKIKTLLMIPPGQQPHSYEPTSQQMRSVAKADIYFKVGSGVEFEDTWMDTIREYNPEMKIVDGSRGIDLLSIGEGEQEDEDNRDQERLDQHVWLSPKNAITMVENLVDDIIEEDPENEEFYLKNSEGYITELRELDDKIKEKLEDHEDEKFLIYHPSFGYFAHRYNLTQVPIQKEGKEPGTKGLQVIIGQAKEDNISVIFVSPQFDKNNAETIAEEIDGEVLVLNPLAEDYLTNMREVAHKLISALKQYEGGQIA